MPIITISRGTLSGGELLAVHLGTKLGYKVISREVIIEAAKKYGVSEEILLEGMKKPPGFWERLTKHKERYILAVQATLAEMIEEGNVIYHGLAGAILLKKLSKVIKLRLIAPMEYRIQSAMIEKGITREDAIKYIERVDEERAKWVRNLYHVEWSDPSLYDLVINLKHINIETAVKLVSELVNRKEYRSTPESDEELKDFVLETRVRAKLAFQSSLPGGTIEFSVQSGVVKFSINPYFEKNKKEIINFVKKIQGVKGVTPTDDESLIVLTTPSTFQKKASDIMIPFSGYPHIHEWNSILEAIVALSASSVKLQDGHFIPPRYILVLNQEEKLVGVLTRRDLIRGLNPQCRSLDKALEQVASVMPMVGDSFAHTIQWVSLFSQGAIERSKEPVKPLMAPIRGKVEIDDDLSVVITTMIQHSIDLIPVMDKEKVVGVILMTDVFDTVAEYIMERGGNIYYTEGKRSK